MSYQLRVKTALKWTTLVLLFICLSGMSSLAATKDLLVGDGDDQNQTQQKPVASPSPSPSRMMIL